MTKNRAKYGFFAAPEDPVFRPKKASAYIGVSESTLAKRRMRGDPPEFVKLGPRLVGYRLSALNKSLEASRRTSTSDSGGSD